MTIEFTETLRPTDRDIQEAIQLRCNECFPAMNICNAIGGSQDTKWRLVREYSLVELIQEARERKLPIETFKTSVELKPITDMLAYIKALSVIEAGGGQHEQPDQQPLHGGGLLRGGLQLRRVLGDEERNHS